MTKLFSCGAMLIWALAALGEDAKWPTQHPLGTNLLAVHLVTSKANPATTPSNDSVIPPGMEMSPQPILSDADFISFDFASQSFVITPNAAKRLIGQCAYTTKSFVLLARGEPIYLGEFKTEIIASCSGAISTRPTINTDSALNECFMGETNISADIVNMIFQRAPGVTDRLMALTNATTNVTLTIDAGMIFPVLGASDQSDHSRDLRKDQRIADAVKILFAERKH